MVTPLFGVIWICSIPIARSIKPVDAVGLLASAPEIALGNSRFWTQLDADCVKERPNLDTACLSAFHWFVLLPSDVAAAVTVEKSIEKGSFYAQPDPRLKHFNE